MTMIDGGGRTRLNMVDGDKALKGYGGLSKGTQGHVGSREGMEAMVIKGKAGRGKERKRHGRIKTPKNHKKQLKSETELGHARDGQGTKDTA